ncbi:MAG TPA: twin-arginine translocation signal domain-containing protein [Candidatus Dormibacteraeota bacterium]|nr:twin-arginine translocation signal domain-containing protein [Candidatus Dormibacteraeota bacterium]
MNPVDRRNFLKMAAKGSAVVAAASVLPFSGVLEWTRQGALKFRAVAGLPKNPLPTYASFVVEGNVDLDRGIGTVTKSLYAGAPAAMSTILFPGTARTIRITTVERSAGRVRLAGVVEGGEALKGRETRNVAIVIDTSRKLAHADFLGTPVVLQVQ